MATWKLAPALAAGNCVVLKPSSFTPASSMELIKEIADLLPPGVVNVVNGTGSTVGQWVLDHPGITKLSFTGSTEVGRTVGHAAAEKIIPATLELGGKSAGIYFGDIPDEKFGDAVACGVQNILMLAGQGCSLQSRILVEDTIYDKYVEALASVFTGFKVGMPWEEDAQMGAIAYQSHMESILGYIDSGIKQGARLVCGGHRITNPPFDKGLFIEPTIFADVDNKMRIAQEEIFGPVVVVIKFHGEQEAIEIANDSVYGLGGGVFAGDLAKAIRVAEAVRTGTVTINGALSNPAGGAFGGFKESGIGRENYKTTLDHFSQLKTIHFPL
jgi:acyl-CoA reductase-like NAD-dependent aldehyde dehydrogenase